MANFAYQVRRIDDDGDILLLNSAYDWTTVTCYHLISNIYNRFNSEITINAYILLLRCHGDAVKHARTLRTASCIPSIVFCPLPHVLLLWLRVPSSGNCPKYYQSSASSVVLGVCFRKHDHTGLGVAIRKVAFWLRRQLRILSTMSCWMLSWFSQFRWQICYTGTNVLYHVCIIRRSSTRKCLLKTKFQTILAYKYSHSH